MVRHGVERNHITYSSLIAAAEKGCRCELALDLFAQMQKEGCKPNTVTFNSLVAACAAGARALGGGGGLGGGVLVHLWGLGWGCARAFVWPGLVHLCGLGPGAMLDDGGRARAHTQPPTPPLESLAAPSHMLTQAHTHKELTAHTHHTCAHNTPVGECRWLLGEGHQAV